ncbi:conserved hypothetical protein [delta proteobacterium NaphS2]|nr:conserved hypothetical protein [delta proteobacterium NaphS2]
MSSRIADENCLKYLLTPKRISDKRRFPLIRPSTHRPD